MHNLLSQAQFSKSRYPKPQTDQAHCQQACARPERPGRPPPSPRPSYASARTPHAQHFSRRMPLADQPLSPHSPTLTPYTHQPSYPTIPSPKPLLINLLHSIKLPTNMKKNKTRREGRKKKKAEFLQKNPY